MRSDGIKGRVTELREAWEEPHAKKNHDAPNHFHASRFAKKAFPDAEPWVEFKRFPGLEELLPQWIKLGLPKETDPGDCVLNVERSELWRYFGRFGELPPLNRVMGKHLGKDYDWYGDMDDILKGLGN